MTKLKLENIFIILLCFFNFLIHSRANKKNNVLNSALVIEMGKLGDMVCTTPMFRAIKNKYPKCKVYVMGDKINGEILQSNGDVDKYFVRSSDFFSNIKLLKQEVIDFACITSPDFRGLAILYLANIPLVTVPVIKNGFSPLETKSYKILRKLVLSRSHRIGSYAGREYLKLLEPIDIFTEDTKKYLSFSDSSKTNISDLLVKYNFNNQSDYLVCLSPSAGNKLKLWGSEKFAKLANCFYQRSNAKIFITGGKNDMEQIKEMINFLDDKVVANVIISVPDDLKDKTKVSDLGMGIKNNIAIDILNLDELKALISVMNLYVSADTGPIYIAEAFNVPTIDITGPVNENEQPPKGDKHKIIFNDVYCRPCSFVMNTARKCKNIETPFACFDVDVEKVYGLYEQIRQTP